MVVGKGRFEIMKPILFSEDISLCLVVEVNASKFVLS